jgi:hypothetical protein
MTWRMPPTHDHKDTPIRSYEWVQRTGLAIAGSALSVWDIRQALILNVNYFGAQRSNMFGNLQTERTAVWRDFLTTFTLVQMPKLLVVTKRSRRLKQVYQYSETNVMHFLLNLFRIKRPLHVSNITCSSSGGSTQRELGILRTCYVSWLQQGWSGSS